METIEFKCPTCDSDRLEEIMVGVIVTTPISNVVIEDGEGDADYDASMTSCADGEVDHYQCRDCGHVIEGARTLSELANVLKGQTQC